MKEITAFITSKTIISGKATDFNYSLVGDVGSVFNVVVLNEDGNFYNFPENTIVSADSGVVRPAGSFSSTPARLFKQKIDETGVYNGVINLPKVTDNDKYSVIVSADYFSETELFILGSNGYINKNVFIAEVNQIVDTSLTFSLSSAGSESVYNDHPSDVVMTGVSTEVLKKPIKRKLSFSWPVTLGSSQFVIAKQPSVNDFYFTTTKDTLNAGSGTSLELKNIEGISVGMEVTGTGIASSSVVLDIIKGYKDMNKSTDSNHVYVIPKEINSSEDGVTDSVGGTVIINNSSTFVADRTITFKSYDNYGAFDFNKTKFNIFNLKLTIDPVVTTTDAVVSNSVTIPLTSTNGIKAADTVLMTGIGVTAASPHVDAISSGVNITASSAQTLENGQTMTFIGSSRSATITGDIEVQKYGKDNLTLTLELDNILTVA